jgi:hypothetical protein
MKINFVWAFVWARRALNRPFRRFPARADDTINDWMLGAEINNPYYGDHPERFALWHMAHHAMFHPGPAIPA